MKSACNGLGPAWWALRIGLGVGFILTGIDQFFNKLVDWSMYLSPLATKITPLSTTTIMHIGGVIEIVAGLILLSRWTRIGAYIAMVWLLLIAANLLTTGMFHDLVVRDIEMAIGAFALAQITAVRNRHTATEEEKAPKTASNS
jgi:uncharacterized membrane protein YphA (DoxX/SURF4 family)